MFEMGFEDQVKSILDNCEESEKTSKFLFSATMQPAIETLAKQVMKNPIRVQIGIKNAAAETVEQKIVYVGKEDGKLVTLRQSI